jgi:hypothetical protein
MQNPNITTKVVHSQTKTAWNVIGELGCKHKVARVPYLVFDDDDELTKTERAEAKMHAEFISYCFNNSDKICVQ